MIIQVAIPYRDPSYDPDWKEWMTDHVIGIRSKLFVLGQMWIAPHVELQFGVRYGYISASSTLRDGAGGFRLKKIDYTKHPLRWFGYELDVTEDEEDVIMECALIMAGYCIWDIIISEDRWPKFPTVQMNSIFYTEEHMKYDLRRVLISNILPQRIIPGRKDYCWCSEAVVMMLTRIPRFKEIFTKNPDVYRPDTVIETLRESEWT